MLRVILCDIDGTLIDSNDAHALSWVDALEQIGKPFPFERIRPLIGMGGDKLLPALKIDPESDVGKEAGDRATRAFIETYLDSIRAFPRARELLEKLVASGYGVWATTSANDKELSALLARTDMSDVFQDATTASMIEESKPSPDVVESALARAGCLPHEAVMLGDTPYDVRAARRGNVRCIAMRCGGWSDDELGGALEIHDDPAALLNEWHESILSRAA
jgi:phosphoglycolate phosphatase-like HAD superfamily hydrolase